MKKFFLLFWLVCLPELIHAQQVISRSSLQMNFRVPYRAADGGEYANGNGLLRELARDVVREPWQVKVVVSFKLSLVIHQQEDKNLLSIFFIDPVINGDVVFRRFPVNDFMLPSKIDMKLRWANRLDTTSFSEIFINKKSLFKPDSLLCSIPIAAFDPIVDTLMIRDVELYYDSVDLSAFKNRLELIHDYYASVSLLDSLEQLAAGIHLDDPACLPVNYIKVEEFNKVLERIQERDFPATLLQKGFDPGRLSEKYGSMYKHSRSLTFTFLDELKKRGAIPWNGDIDILAGVFTGRIHSYICLSKLMDQLQSQIYQDYLDHYFDKSSFPPEENVIGLLLSKMYPDARVDTIAGYISGRIYNSYRDKARQLMSQNQYSGAFSMMEHARGFFGKNSSIYGVTPDNDLLSKAAYGIYNSYTGIAQECIRNRKYSLADTYLAKADQYVREHATLIGSDSLYLAVFSELFFLRNSECDLILDQMKFAEALDCYHSFELRYNSNDLKFVRNQLNEKKNQARTGLFYESVSRSEDALKRNQTDTAVLYYERALQLRNEIKGPGTAFGTLDSLAPSIARIRIEQFFYSGAHALDQRQFTLALNQFTEAKALSDQYGLERDRIFDSIYRHAMKNCLIIQLSAAQKMIWANQFDSANLALEKTKTTGFNYGLTDDPDFSTALNKFATKIREQQCRIVHDSVNLQMIRADRSIALKNYINASGYLQQALVFIASAQECSFSDKPIRDTLAKYTRAASYQKKLSDARSHAASGDYTEAVRELDENEQAFQKYRLDRFGFIMDGVHDFISQRSNPYLTERAIAYYYGMGNIREAMRFLHLLRIQGYPGQSAALMQSQLGKTLALQDYQVNARDASTSLVEQYTSNDSWYDVFRSAYLNEWNRLAKTAPAGR